MRPTVSFARGTRFALLLVLFLLFIAAPGAWALTPEQALAIASGDNDARIEALNATAASNGDARLAAFVQALLADEVKVASGQAYVVHDGNAAVWAAAIRKGRTLLALRNADGTPKWTPATEGTDGCGVNHLLLPVGTER